MDKGLVNSLFRQKISEAKELVDLRKQALRCREREYSQAKKSLNSQKDSLHSAECELEYLEKHKKELEATIPLVEE